MSIKAHANYTPLVLTNDGRNNANPPIVFPGFTTDASQQFSFSIWLRMNSQIPAPITDHHAHFGSSINIGTDGFSWQVNGRHGSVGLPTIYLGNVVYGRWTLLCFAKSGPTISVFIGVEDTFDTNPWERPVEIALVAQFDYGINTEPFAFFLLYLSSAIDICNFKFWNNTLTQAQFKAQANTWLPTGSPAPIWASPLRTAGDLSNIANPDSTIYWTYSHGYNLTDFNNIVTAGSFGAWNDPAYLSNSQACPAWIYPIGFPTQIGTCSINPGLTPLIPTIYKAPQFFQFDDRGSVPHVDSSIQSIVHYATVIADPTLGQTQSDSFGLYKNEGGIEVSPDFSNPANRFEQDSGVTIPGTITATTMYMWKFGAQFRWQPYSTPPPPQVATGVGALVHQFLYVTYIGFPTGFPLLSEQDLSGLFVLDKGNLVRADAYNRAVNLKIPNPTIRTAYIGE